MRYLHSSSVLPFQSNQHHLTQQITNIHAKFCIFSGIGFETLFSGLFHWTLRPCLRQSYLTIIFQQAIHKRKEKSSEILNGEEIIRSKLNLPSSVFASEVEEDVGLLNKGAPQGNIHKTRLH